jgi:hypothetical protein
VPSSGRSSVRFQAEQFIRLPQWLERLQLPSQSPESTGSRKVRLCTKSGANTTDTGPNLGLPTLLRHRFSAVYVGRSLASAKVLGRSPLPFAMDHRRAILAPRIQTRYR